LKQFIAPAVLLGLAFAAGKFKVDGRIVAGVCGLAAVSLARSVPAVGSKLGVI
jgi:hypothetical protein